LGVAGPLVVSPIGDLYVADTAANRVLVRLPDGRFRTVVGTGQMGFAGDGGPALSAELTRVTDLATAADGSLYIADGARVRVVGPDGVIHTVAGDGASTSTPVVDDTPALSASLAPQNSLSLALSPSGQLYISTGYQLLRLSGGRLDAVRTVVRSGFMNGGTLDNLGQVAVDAQGNIDVSGFNGWAIWQVAPTGVATEVGLPEARRSGGGTSVLERAPDGAVYGEMGSTLVKVDGRQLVAAYSFPDSVQEYFPLTHFAFASDGTIYADDVPGGGGFEARQQLVSLSYGHESSLWQQTPPTAPSSTP
jgi:hypothetical protein